MMSRLSLSEMGKNRVLWFRVLCFSMPAGQWPLTEGRQEVKREARMIQGEVVSLWSRNELIPQSLKCLLKLSFLNKYFKIY